MRIIWVLERIASISLEGARATRMNLLATPTVSIIRRRYACLIPPRWSASSITNSRLTGILPGSISNSSPAGAISPSEAKMIPRSYASKLIRPANVSVEPAPVGLRNSSNLAIAPRVLIKSRACKICVVDFHPGPSIWRATNRQEAVFPTPAGPVIRRCGGSGDKLVPLSASRTVGGTARSSKVRGACVLSQLATY